MKQKNSLTEGKIFTPILLFFIPVMLGNVFQQFYSLVDSIIVGQYLGRLAFSGVGATSSLSFLVIGFSTGLTSGFAIKTSQFYGAKDEEQMKRSVATSYILCIIIGILLTLVAVLCTTPLLKMMQTSDSLFPYAHDYLITIFLGLGATIFYNMISFLLRSIGDSRSPLYFLLISSIINIVLDIVFISIFHMGVSGAGYATFIAQLVSGMISFIYMWKKYPILRVKREHFHFSFDFAMEHLRIALPMALQFSIIAIGLMIQQAAVNHLDALYNPTRPDYLIDGYATAYSAANKIDSFALQILSSLGTTMATFCGQNYGARNYERIKKGFKVSTIFGTILCVILGAIMILFGAPMIRIFSSDIEETIMGYAKTYLIIQGSLYFFVMLIYVYRSSLQGLGLSSITVVAGILELAMRALTCIFFTQFLGWIGVGFSNPAAWIGSDVVLLIATIYYMKKFSKQVKEGTFGVLSKDKERMKVEPKHS